MNDLELRVTFGIIPDPDNNFVNVNKRSIREEVERVIRIFDINKKQKEVKEGMIIRNLTTLELVQSNN